MQLIDRDKLKQYIDDCKCCEKCNKKGFRCDMCCELPDCVTPQWERVLNEQPTVDAIPIEWIKEYIRTHPASTDIYFKWMIDEWKEEQEKADKKKSYFPKGFFSKERPIAKGEDKNG